MTAVAEGTLVAQTRAFDSEVDLLDVCGDGGVVWIHNDHGFAGHGVAREIPVTTSDPAGAADAVDAAFAGIEHDDMLGVRGAGPVAVGALPFDPGASGTLVIPRVLVGRTRDGTLWITTVGRVDEPLIPGHREAREPTSFSVVPHIDPGDWREAVHKARRALSHDGHRKVVLARAVDVSCDAEISPTAVLRRLRRSYAGCMLYGVDGFIGASPELLVSRSGDVVRAHPMAGTAPRSTDPRTDAALAAGLLASDKDRWEHQITIDMVHDTLLPWCSYLDWEPEPGIVALANVQHLATLMEGRLSEPAASVVELMGALHPTPAVCGDPRDASLAVIAELESLDRGNYAGPVGWVDAEGNGEWAVGIRCAEIDGAVARLYAGVGVVEDSDPDAELAETRVKLQALLNAIIQP